MKINKFYLIILIIAGACLGFFGLVYWNNFAVMKQARAGEMQLSNRLKAVEDFLAPPQADNNNQK